MGASRKHECAESRCGWGLIVNLSIERLSSYGARYDKLFEVPSFFRGGGTIKCTAIERLRHLIDTDWAYSMYWPEDDFNGLLDMAQDNLTTEINKSMARIAELKEAQDILSTIDREDHEDATESKS